MNILIIARKYLIQNLRKPLALIMLCAAPIALIMILSQAFSGIFAAAKSGAIALKLGYRAENESQLGATFAAFAEGAGPLGISTSAESDKAEGVRKTAEGEYQAFVNIYGESDSVELIVNNNSGIKAGLSESIIAGFLKRYRYLQLAARHGLEPTLPSGSYVQISAFDGTRQARALDYFGVTITTMGIIFSCNLAGHWFSKERTNKTLARLQTTPLTKGQYLTGACLGTWTILTAQVLIVFAAAKFGLGVYFGNDTAAILIILFALSFFSLALGFGSKHLFKDDKAGNALLNILPPIMIFLGGGYMKLPDTAVFNALSKFSPLSWVNKALIEAAFSDQRTYFFPALGLCVGLGAALLAAAAIVSLRREEI